MPADGTAPASPATAAGPRTKPAAQRRRDLLDAGLAVFLAKGVAAATLDQITRQAGIAKGTFYLHFESKEHLLAALQTDFETALVMRIDSAVHAAATAGGDWGRRLDAWLSAALADYPTDHALHDVLFYHPLLADPGAQAGVARHRERTRDLVDSLTDLINGGIAAGAYTAADPELVAMLLCSALHRAFDRIWHRDDPIDLDRLSAAMRQLFHRALGM